MDGYPAEQIGIRCEDCGALPDEAHEEECIYAEHDDEESAEERRE